MGTFCSYGGSHNPHEAELQTDLTRATLLQLTVLKELLQRKDLEGLNLYRFTEKKIPSQYRERLEGFISGALHDTCNVAAAASGG